VTVSGGTLNAARGGEEYKAPVRLSVSLPDDTDLYPDDRLTDEERAAVVGAVMSAAVSALPERFTIAFARQTTEARTVTEVARR
jgi:hypothetical protein